ncbi:MAG: hypothetical protein FWC71_09560 [Defluviitaleaceae bacterium]|nr:hypothetical protein [Defluviitaleaceae bacterium]
MKKRLICFSLALVLSIVSLLPVYATGSGHQLHTFNYNEWNIPVPSPDAYRVADFILGEHLGIGHFNNPRDLQVHGNLLYVADTENHRIVINEFFEDGTFDVADVVEHVFIDGVPSTFDRPNGIFVSPWAFNYGEIWIADTHNNRILHVDSDWNLITLIDRSKLERSALEEHNAFLPNKIAVDFSGRIFVQATHVNRGLMEFDHDGYFAGYMGAPDVTVTPWERFWRMLATREQRDRGWLFVPVEYNSVSIDREGFLMVTTASEDVESVRRLNAMGSDVMIRNGFDDPQGDTWWGSAGHIGGPSVLVAATGLPNGTFVVFDSNRGRLFKYDTQGHMLYAWAGTGHHEGFFMNPSALDSMGFDLFALDAQMGAITRFVLTEYGTLINEALELYQRGHYEESYTLWREVLRMNGNFQHAYGGVARALLRRGYYRQAMHYFRLTNDNSNFGRAFGFYRRIWMEENFWIFVVVVGVLVIVPPVVKKVLKVRREILAS